MKPLEAFVGIPLLHIAALGWLLSVRCLTEFGLLVFLERRQWWDSDQTIFN